MTRVSAQSQVMVRFQRWCIARDEMGLETVEGVDVGPETLWNCHIFGTLRQQYAKHTEISARLRSEEGLIERIGLIGLHATVLMVLDGDSLNYVRSTPCISFLLEISARHSWLRPLHFSSLVFSASARSISPST